MAPFERAAFRYTPYFCEENAWWLAHELIARGGDADAMEVLFLLNRARRVGMRQQRAAAPGWALSWDYHAVLAVRPDDAPLIFDLDSRLDFPSRAAAYLDASFPDQQRLPEDLRVLVRRVPAAAYLERFCSDRSHMHGVVPAAAFPNYPPLCAPPQRRPIMLAAYRDPDRRLDDGSAVVPLAALRAGLAGREP